MPDVGILSGMPTRGGPVHVVTTTRHYKGRVYTSHLLRRSFREGGKVRAVVEPEELDHHDPLANLVGLENALYLNTDLLGEVGIVQRTGSLTQTAYALLSDLSRISQRLRDL